MSAEDEDVVIVGSPCERARPDRLEHPIAISSDDDEDVVEVPSETTATATYRMDCCNRAVSPHRVLNSITSARGVLPLNPLITQAGVEQVISCGTYAGSTLTELCMSLTCEMCGMPLSTRDIGAVWKARPQASSQQTMSCARSKSWLLNPFIRTRLKGRWCRCYRYSPALSMSVTCCIRLAQVLV